MGIPDILASVGQNSLLSLVNVNNFLIDNEIVRNRGVNELLDLFSISIEDEEHFSCTSTDKCPIPKNYQTSKKFLCFLQKRYAPCVMLVLVRIQLS